MGKAKKTKTRQDVVIGNTGAVNTNKAATNDLEGDLASLDETKRLKACTMLSDLYVFNKSNKSSLASLASSQILSKLSMRLVDSSNNVRIQAALALHSLSDCSDSDVITRIVNVGLFRAAISLSMEFASLGINNGDFAEQLFFSIANIIPLCNNAAQELTRCGVEFSAYLLSLISTSGPWNIVCAVANLLSVITNVKSSSAAGISAFVDVDALTNRVWAFMVEIQSYDASRLAAVQLNNPGVVLVQCAEVVCNVFMSCTYSPALAEKCHVNDVLVFTAQLLSSSGASAEQTQYTLTKLVSSFVLNLLGNFSSDDVNIESTICDIEERRNSRPQQTLNTDPKLLTVAASLEGVDLLSHCYAALNRVVEGVKADVAQCVVTTTDEVTNLATTSVVINRNVQEGFECLEQLLNATEQFVLLKAINGPFQAELSPFVGVAQYLLDVVSCFTVSLDSSKVASNAWSYGEHVNENSLRDTVLNTTTAVLEFIGSLCKISYNSINGVVSTSASPAGACFLFVSEETLKGVALLLIRCSSFSFMELSLSAVLVMGILGQRGDQTVALGQGPTQVTLKLTVPVSLNALLSNSLLRRCQEPNAYSADNSSNGVENVARSTLIVMDGCFNSLIDLHCSDDLAYLENFNKLKCVDKLLALSSDFNTKLRDPACRRLDDEDREKFAETLENLGNFVAYKQDAIRSATGSK